MVLAEHPLAERRRKIQHSVYFIGNHLSDRNTCPAGYYLRNGLPVNDRLHQRIFALNFAQFFGQAFQLGPQQFGIFGYHGWRRGCDRFDRSLASNGFGNGRFGNCSAISGRRRRGRGGPVSAAIPASARRQFCVDPRHFKLEPNIADLVHQFLFFFPLLLELCEFFLRTLSLLFKIGNPVVMSRTGYLFALQGVDLQGQVLNSSRRVF